MTLHSSIYLGDSDNDRRILWRDDMPREAQVEHDVAMAHALLDAVQEAGASWVQRQAEQTMAAWGFGERVRS